VIQRALRLFQRRRSGGRGWGVVMVIVMISAEAIGARLAVVPLTRCAKKWTPFES